MSLRRISALAAVAAAAALLPAGAHAAALRPVRATMPSELPGTTLLGPAPAGQVMEVGVLLAHPDPAAEDRLLAALYDRSSPDFHRFLSPQEYARRFGVPAGQRAAVSGWLRDGGLTVEADSGAGDYVLARGTAAQVGALTHTRMGRYSHGGQEFVGNEDAPSVPAALPVLDLEGLNTYQRYRPATTQAAAPDPTGDRTPEELWSIYEQPDSQTGAGVPVAILGSGATAKVIDDLHQFDTEHGFQQLPVDVVHTPAAGDYSDESGDEEWNIDMQAIHGMAPSIDREVMYFSPTLADSQLTASLATWVNDPQGPPIMNASLGECEAVPVVNPILNNAALQPINGNEGGTLPVSQGLSQSSEPATTMLLQQAVMEGRNFFASSGDNGSSCTVVYPGANGVANEAVPLTSDPASVPFANAVGGTVLYSDGGAGRAAKRSLERAWEFSGGNASPFITAPAYQQGIANLDRPCVADEAGAPTNTGRLCRGVPDVAALSGDVVSNGYTIVSDGKDASGGGTSLSSPLWAGMWARVVGSAPRSSTGFGFADEAFYAIARDPARYKRSFFDITVGTNGLNPALAGYDYVTGLGAPRVAGLLQDVPAVAPARSAAAASGGGSTGAGAGSAGGAGVPSCRDVVAPISRFTRSGSHLTRTGVRLAGTSSDRGCGRAGVGRLARVTVAIGRATGSRCRFLTAKGTFGPKVSCLRTTYVAAAGTSTWSLRLRRRLPRGSYKLFVRGVDAAGNVERKQRTRNFLALRVR